MKDLRTIITLSIVYISLNDKSIHSSLNGSLMISDIHCEKSDHSVIRLLLNRMAVVSCFFFSTCSLLAFLSYNEVNKE